ncbi:MAG: hypothetical protein A3Q59_06475 [Methanomethylophilus alvi]|nr:MAG: hypothetical protein A3Q59_06475 [Methanomethylophilus alvi]
MKKREWTRGSEQQATVITPVRRSDLGTLLRFTNKFGRFLRDPVQIALQTGAPTGHAPHLAVCSEKNPIASRMSSVFCFPIGTRLL